MNNNFYAVNMHGYELKQNFVIPEHFRVIMFCYSGGIFDVCHKLDKFIWSVLINNQSVKDYKSFLSVLSKYPSFRDHFCVYKPGDTIKDIEFDGDDEFTHGVFQLPISVAVHDEQDNKVYTTDSDITAKILIDPELSPYPLSPHITINHEKASSILRFKDNKKWISSSYLLSTNYLSDTIKKIKRRQQGATILLLTCREGTGYDDISQGIKIKQELLNIT